MKALLGRCYLLLEKANSSRNLFHVHRSQPVGGIFNRVDNVSKSYKTQKLFNNKSFLIKNCDKNKVSGASYLSSNRGHFARNLSNQLPLKQQHQLRKMPRYQIVEKGTPNSKKYRIYFKNNCGKIISPFHDIPMFSNDEKTLYNMVVEIPRWTNAKMEICLDEVFNPIRQDVKKDKLRFVANCFPHKGYIWNYGAIPQTWENPNHIEPSTGAKGDNDPVDAIEIGSRVAQRGDVLSVKVLGVFALIDEGETDWKVVTIDVNDPVADKLNDIEDVEQFFPGLMRATVEWFRIYKVPDGKPENQFAFCGDAKNAAFAKEILDITHDFWTCLLQNPCEGKTISCKNTTQSQSEDIVQVEEAAKILEDVPNDGEAEEIGESVDRWHFVQLK